MTDDLMKLDESALRARLLARVAPNQTIELAIAVASEAHRGRLRDEGTPYVCHVFRTALILIDELHIIDTDPVCAALLRDVLEDGVGIALEQLRETFGARVTAMVHCLTDEFKHSGLPRAERKKLYLQRVAAADDDCLIVKLCDRLDNLRSLPDSPSPEKREQVSRETRVHLMPRLSQRSGTFSLLNRLLQEALHYEAICRYRDLRPDYQLLSDHLEKVLLSMAQVRGMYPIVTARAKSLESFAEKIQRPGKDYIDPVTEITDLCGVRVIVHTLDQVDAMAAAVRDQFEIDLRRSEDKRERLAYREFGYLSTHYIIQLKKQPHIEGELPETLQRLATLKAELQLRTVAQHLWADVYHELGYKNEFKLPPLYERQFGRIAALLEVCDKVLLDIKSAMGAYESTYRTYMDDQELEALVEQLGMLLRVDPENVRAVHRLIRAHLALGNHTQIAAIREKYGHLLASNPAALGDVGAAVCKIDETAGQDLLKEAIRMDPRNVDALCSLGGSYRREKRLAEARDCYRKAHAIDHSYPYALSNYIALEVLLRHDTGIIDCFHAPLTEAIERCKRQIEVKVNLPWALFDLGMFEFYLGNPYAAIGYYAKGIDVALHAWMIQSANKPIEDFMRESVELNGLRMLDKLLKLGWWIKAGRAEREKSEWRPAAAAVSFRPPVLILAGGCAGLESWRASRLGDLKDALASFRGAMVSGGTRSGVAEIAGDLQAGCGAPQLQTVGYLPATLPPGAEADTRYTTLRRTEGTGFSPSEPLAFWEDFLAAGGDATAVKLIGFNGGPIAACEFRVALAFGAQVGIIQDSGRAADDLLVDPLWQDRQGDRRPLHSLGLGREDVERFLAL